MVAACQQLGISTAKSRLIRLGENAIFHVPGDSIVVRVGRSFDEMSLELNIAIWLAQNGVPGVEPRHIELGVLEHQGYPVTFWNFIDQHEIQPTAEDLGLLIRHIHQLKAPDTFTLPTFVAMPKIEHRLESFRGLFEDDDIEFIRIRKQSIESNLSEIDSALGWGPIHGDAHLGNLMRDRSGITRIIDYGDFCIGPREWDICALAVGFKVGTVKESNYRAFAHAYGFDALTWDGFDTIQAARELNMTTWLMQLHGYSPEIDKEIKTRLSDLRSGSVRRWKPF